MEKLDKIKEVKVGEQEVQGQGNVRPEKKRKAKWY